MHARSSITVAQHEATRLNDADLIADRLKQRFAIGRGPRAVRGTAVRAEPKPGSRHIPHDVRRAVVERDGTRCTYTSEDGRRCEQRGLLELHHEEPQGRGGASSVENVRVLCRAHNQLLAERDYGRGLVRRRIEERRSGVCGAACACWGSRAAPSGAGIARRSRAGIVEVLRIGVPVGVQFWLEAFAFTFASFMVGWISVDAVAAHQIAINMVSLTFMVPLGISMGASARVGNLIGARDAAGMRRAVSVALAAGAGVMTFRSSSACAASGSA